MGYIKEPKGVDFIIQSEPLTEEARQQISEFIRNYKSKSSGKEHNRALRTSKKKKTV